jgi:hypothetical protein
MKYIILITYVIRRHKIAVGQPEITIINNIIL